MLLIQVNFLFATDYYVSTTGNDANNGTQASPWRTIQKACVSVVANAGHTINLGAGTFSENAVCEFPSGTNLVGAGRNETIITSSVYPILNIKSGSKNIVMHSFTMDGRKKALWQAIKAGNMNGFEAYDFNLKEFGYYSGQPYFYIATFDFEDVSNIKIHDFEGTNTASGYNGTFGVHAVDNIEIFNGKIINDEVSKGKIFSCGDERGPIVSNIKIHDNTFLTSSVGGWALPGTNNFTSQIAMEFWNVIMLNCEIYNNVLNANLSLIQVASYDYSNASVNSVHIHHNVWNCDRNVGYQTALELMIDNSEVDHNYIYGGAYPIGSFGDAGTKPLKNVKIHHNVFEAQSISQLVINITNSTTNLSFTNNTVYESSNLTMINLGNVTTNATVTNNIFYQNGSTVDNTNPPATLNNNLFYNIVPHGSNAITTNPMFVGNGAKPDAFFSLQTTSPAIDKGIVIAGITDGFSGTSPDLGAFEYGQAPWKAGVGAAAGAANAFDIPSTIEAEKAILAGGTGVNINHTGYSGTGFVDKYEAAGTSILFNLNAAKTSDFSVKLTFSNGLPTVTSLSLYLNGVKVKQIALASTSTWEAWTTRTDTLFMKAGLNKLEYVFDAADGGHTNLDKIEVIGLIDKSNGF